MSHNLGVGSGAAGTDKEGRGSPSCQAETLPTHVQPDAVTGPPNAPKANSERLAVPYRKLRKLLVIFLEKGAMVGSLRDQWEGRGGQALGATLARRGG